MGGAKVEVEWTFKPEHLQWMEKVHSTCGHASVDKTMRIMLDFYMSYAKKDPALEVSLFDPQTAEGKEAKPHKTADADQIDNTALQAELQAVYREGVVTPTATA